MDHLIHEHELEKLKLQARGNPAKLAVYSTAKSEYQLQLNDHFNEDFPFVNSFSESHLESLREFATQNPDDESAQVRFALQQSRFEAKQDGKTAHIDRRLVQGELIRKLQAEEVTKSDLAKAELLVKTIGSEDNRVLYANIKSQLNGGNE